MKTSKTARFDELMRLKNEFNEKLKDSFEKYESRIKKYHSKEDEKNHLINKSPTIIGLSKRKNLKSVLPPLEQKYTDEKDYIYKLPKRSRSQAKGFNDTWKPQYMICDYFDIFRRLRDEHDLDNWEKVISNS